MTKIPKKKIHSMSLPRQSLQQQQPSTNQHVNHNATPPRACAPSKVSAAQINGYHPTHLYSSMLPIESEEEMLRSHRRETATNLINFSCIDYDSLVDYCNTFGLHRFEYQYHYDLATTSSMDRSRGSLATKCSDDAHPTKTPKDGGDGGDGARIRGSKREMDEDEESRTEIEEKGKRKRGRKSKKTLKNGSDSETEHHYFNSDLLDRHYEKRPRQRIPKTFDASSRLTKSELVSIVREHFLATPLLAELNEIAVFQQFLRFIVERRNKLKKELVVRK